MCFVIFTSPYEAGSILGAVSHALHFVHVHNDHTDAAAELTLLNVYEDSGGKGKGKEKYERYDMR